MPASSATVGTSYTFQPTVAQGSGIITFAIEGLPRWGTFGASTGKLSGIPTNIDVGLSEDVTITASNGSSTGSVGPFTIRVSAAPASTAPVSPPLVGGPAAAPPVIGGSPATSITSGHAYSFQPSASDTNGSVVHFSIVNRPAWASFSTQTGLLSGTPSAAQSGFYSGILISASDGSASASLHAFAITVIPSTPVNAATLAWAAPTENSDGSPIINLAGYHIHYGTNRSAMTQVIDVAGHENTTYVVGGLSTGTYYFAVSAYNSLGTDGALSNIVSKTF